ncbi:hypothetical protein [Planctomicrobium sp. SH664]|uniref:hypothetical protein n=1 Tax=Planctomicrobium sp. SH664 TaxID=3448125 RepID=UPI003F5BA905
MPPRFEECSQLVEQLCVAIPQLESAAHSCQLRPLPEREWYELLHRKLRPQLGAQSFLIVAVVGGTNIGKSVIFNHIAGAQLSATSPLASGTKHPTALLREDLANRINLEELFPGFEITRWEAPQQPLEEDTRDLLFYRCSDAPPENLIVLDTPDVDSVAQVNWVRADHIRQSADVLIAVLTQQKYNDAAVKDFFRKAAQEDKLVFVVFNQVQLPDDEGYWPLWLETFCKETGTKPHAVLLASYDRKAAEGNRLPFYERTWPLPAEPNTEQRQPLNLLAELSQLRFGEIKLQALSGALRQLVDESAGIPEWLREIQSRSTQFGEALELLSANRLVEINRWPTLPNSVLTSEIRHWWSEQREGLTATVHGFYQKLGKALAYPVQIYREKRGTQPLDPIEAYREREWETVLEVLERAIERLSWLRDLGNPLLTPRLNELLGGKSRADIIEKIRHEHQQLDLTQQVKQLIDVQLQQFRQDRPDAYKLFRKLDSAAAAARPAISVALFMTGAGPLAHVVGPAVTDTALHGVIQLAGDAIGGTVVTAVGDKVLTDTASTGAGYVEARFRQLHESFAQQRANWMAWQLEKHLFENLPQELSEASGLTRHAAFREVRTLVNQLRSALGSSLR